MRAFALAMLLITFGCAPDQVVTTAESADADTVLATDAAVVSGTEVRDTSVAVDATTDPCLGIDCDDQNVCTTDSCFAGTCQHDNNTASCDDGNVCTGGDTCTAGACAGLPIDCTNVCGNAICDGEETPVTCPGDCSWLWQRLKEPCGTPGTLDICPHGYVCVARSAVGGGNVCVSDTRSWLPLPDARTPTDFVDDGETVRDTATGLQWPKKQLSDRNWHEAGTACMSESYNGLHDWRLPTETELLSLVDIDKVMPSSVAPLQWPTSYSWYWSAMPWSTGTSAWLVLFTYGYTGGHDKNFPFAVWCVRGGSTLGTGGGSRFAVSDDGITVFDHASGLRWQHAVQGNYAASEFMAKWGKLISGLPGTGWRLPTRDELLTLVDRQSAGPAIDTSVFPNTPIGNFWSSSPSNSGFGTWCVSFDNGISNGPANAATVRAVTTYPCNATTCDDGNPCTTDSCPMGSCHHDNHSGACDDGIVCTTNDSCFAGSCIGQPNGCAILCGNGICDGDETPTTCVADCRWLWQHLSGTCTTPGVQDVCAHGYVCVARGSTAGGNICVSDIHNWLPLPDTRTPSDFVDDGKTVTDKVTGLQWAKDTLPKMDWNTALAACTTQTYAGVLDWRLPTETELLSVTDVVHPAYDLKNTAALIWPKFVGYWISCWSAVELLLTNSGWQVDFPVGVSYPLEFSAKPLNFVACVRGGATVTTGTGSRFAASADGKTVFDHASGLQWQRAVATSPANWADAKSWCAKNVTGAPGTGWRMPTRGELLTLIDREANHPAIDITAFPATPNAPFWSASPGLSIYSDELVIDFDTGQIYNDTPSSLKLVRCVR